MHRLRSIVNKACLSLRTYGQSVFFSAWMGNSAFLIPLHFLCLFWLDWLDIVTRLLYLFCLSCCSVGQDVYQRISTWHILWQLSCALWLAWPNINTFLTSTSVTSDSDSLYDLLWVYFIDTRLNWSKLWWWYGFLQTNSFASIGWCVWWCILIQN